MKLNKLLLSIAALALTFQIQLAHAANPKVEVETSADKNRRCLCHALCLRHSVPDKTLQHFVCPKLHRH